MSSNDVEQSPHDETVLKEIEWGATYRHDQKQKRRPSIPPKFSPINLQKIWEHYQITKQLDEFQRMNWQIFAKPPPVGIRLQKRKAQVLDRNSLSKKQYLNLLATPKRIYQAAPDKLQKRDQMRNLKKKLAAERCSPRLIELAMPRKQRVLYVWRDYEHLIPPDFIPRLQDLLNADRTLDLKFARCYFKTLDKKRKHALAKMRRKRQRRLKRRQKDCDKFLNNQIKSLAKLLAEYIRQEPLMALNFKQTLISDAILNSLVRQKQIKRKPPRNSNNAYKQGILDITDQVSVWMDAICRYVDVQYTESDEELAEPSTESMEGEEEEYEGEEEEEEEPVKRFSLPPLELPPLGPLPPLPPRIAGLDHGEGEGGEFGTVTVLEALLGQVATGGAGAGDLMLDPDTLELLISILSSSTPEMLAEEINPDVLPGITYNEILERLKKLRDLDLQARKKQRQVVLEEIMIAWAKANRPEQIDDNMITKIQYAAGILAQCLSKEGIQMMQKVQEELAGAEEGEGGESGVPKGKLAGEGVEPISDADETLVTGEEGTFSEGGKGQGEDTIGAGELPTDQEGAEGDTEGLEGTDGGAAGTGEEGAEGDELAGRKLGGTGEEGDLSDLEGTDTLGMKGLSEAGEGADETDMDITEELAAMAEGEGGASLGLPPHALDITDSTTAELEGRLRGEAGEEGGLPKTASELARQAATGSYDKLRTAVPGVIPAHKPPKTYEHSPDTICCLTLKVWATWLLEVANNAHVWSKWINDIIQEVRRIASIIRGEVRDVDGNPMQFYKEDWIAFSEKVDHMIVSWRQYSMHVKDLTDKLIKNFKGKGVRCCPKCLEDNLIVNITVAHDITEQLAEAMNTAAYWRRWLDTVVMETKRLTTAVVSGGEDATSSQGSSYYGTVDIVEIVQPQATDSDESLYEIEEIDDF